MTSWATAAATAAEYAEQTEADGAVARPVVDQLIADGAMKLWVPARYGGGETHLQVGLDAMAAVGRGCGSSGWAVMIANTTGLLASRLTSDAGELLFGGPASICGGFAPPTGVATIGTTTARVTGQWPWGSGSSHATTMGGGVRYVNDAGEPVELGGRSRTGFAFFHAGVELLDTWNVAGMEGTASTDYRVDDVAIPLDHIVPLDRRLLEVDGPLYRFSVFGALALGVSMVMVGMGERALDELATLAEKVPQGSGRGLGERATAQVDIARADAALRAARALVGDVVGTAWEEVITDGQVSDKSRVALRLAANHAAESSVSAVDRCYRTAGGAAVYKRSPLQRVFRDVHVAAQHAMVSERIFEPIGRYRFGLETDLRPL
ncbi:MAG: acyl-CoA dehydrogenase family protein [Acidimicrobiales bacterium]|nr:acyl-CoA dehydrogenase family protein [Acidimicrobiales bacterium]